MSRTFPGSAALRLTMTLFLSVLLVAGGAARAGADPDEGGTEKLRSTLEATAKAHIDAQAKLKKSIKKQRRLQAELQRAEKDVTALTAQVQVLAAASYQRGRLSTAGALLNSISPQDFLQRSATLELLTQRDSRRLGDLHRAREEASRAKLAVDQEIREQRKQTAVMAQKKKDAEAALAEVSQGASGGFVAVDSPAAKPAPRNSDGSWPAESCSVDDPTTSGCITPRMLHAMQQGQAAGYNRHVSCHRGGGFGEHPKGRACDFAAAVGGFTEVHASGGDKAYGDAVTSFYVKNADRLGVLYVIWYRQIWHPGTGWQSYSGGGSPAGDHTNHVHVSMY